ncbi:hypothetical protein BJG93_00785 [Paraburkholderia sprentiae WSM5005]|uniref:Integrase n=1 Tax=Paraburkholderia sprentiae WSM5005 TaxID=754502 RepID=A0A1I9YCR5_9BURK|nr:hypothetical protein [Paraburkholderia sprentiae]APA84098.2 hypothetical protein BJG93_00785 [Paraburkholderia sprentiae WSM5005]
MREIPTNDFTGGDASPVPDDAGRRGVDDITGGSVSTNPDCAQTLASDTTTGAGSRARRLVLGEKQTGAQVPANPASPVESRRLGSPPALVYDSPGKPTALSHSVVRRICAMRAADWEMTFHGDRNINTGDKARDRIAAKELVREMRPFSRRMERMTRTVIARGNAARAWDSLKELALEYAEDVAYLIAPDDPLLPDLVLAFAETERAAHDVISAILDGKGAKFDVPESSGALLSAMIPVYVAHKSRSVDAKSVSKALSVWNRLMAFVGDIPLNDVTAHDIYRFLEDRLNTDRKPWSQSYVDGFVRQALREVFALARTHGHMHADNPLNHLEVTPKISKQERKERTKPRFPYTVAQVKTVFASDWYDPNATHWRGKMATDLALRYWGPPISLCHGPRVREMTQLVNSDFTVCENVLLMTIQVKLEDADDPTPESIPQLPERKLKNDSAWRTIPVHPQLLALGFAEFVRECQAQHPPGTPLFPSAVPDEGGKAPLWGRAYEQAFLRFVRDTLGFGHGYGNHSFRHLFEDRLRDAQLIHGAWPVGLGEFVSGRRLPRAVDRDIFRQQSSAIDYGDGYFAAHIQRYVAQIDFEGVVFPPPYAEWLARRT